MTTRGRNGAAGGLARIFSSGTLARDYISRAAHRAGAARAMARRAVCYQSFSQFFKAPQCGQRTARSRGARDQGGRQ